MIIRFRDILAILVIIIMVAGCNTDENGVAPSDTITTVDHSFSGYTALDVSTAFEVVVQFSETEEQIQIKANENLHQYIEVKKEGNTLVIGMVDNVNVQGDATLKAHIITKGISNYSASGATAIDVQDTIFATVVNVSLSGASTFVGIVKAEELSVGVSGASIVSMSGESANYNLMGTGASVLGGFGLVTDFLELDLSGASIANVTVNAEMRIKASGASVVNYKGTGTIVSQELSGSSVINKLD